MNICLIYYYNYLFILFPSFYDITVDIFGFWTIIGQMKQFEHHLGLWEIMIQILYYFLTFYGPNNESMNQVNNHILILKHYC